MQPTGLPVTPAACAPVAPGLTPAADSRLVMWLDPTSCREVARTERGSTGRLVACALIAARVAGAVVLAPWCAERTLQGCRPELIRYALSSSGETTSGSATGVHEMPSSGASPPGVALLADGTLDGWRRGSSERCDVRMSFGDFLAVFRCRGHSLASPESGSTEAWQQQDRGVLEKCPRGFPSSACAASRSQTIARTAFMLASDVWYTWLGAFPALERRSCGITQHI